MFDYTPTGSQGILNRSTVFEPVHEHAARPNGCLGWFMHVYGHVSKLTPVHTPSFNIVSVLVRFRCMNRFRIGVAIPPWTGPESATNCTHGEPVHGFEPVQTPPRQILAIGVRWHRCTCARCASTWLCSRREMFYFITPNHKWVYKHETWARN